jgi:hypothetical protein
MELTELVVHYHGCIRYYRNYTNFVFFSNEYVPIICFDVQLAQGGTAVGTGLNTKKG